MSDTKILVAADSGVIVYKERGAEQRAVIHKGVTRVHPDHPMVKGNEELFKPLDLHFDVETARAEPTPPKKR